MNMQTISQPRQKNSAPTTVGVVSPCPYSILLNGLMFLKTWNFSKGDWDLNCCFDLVSENTAVFHKMRHLLTVLLNTDFRVMRGKLSNHLKTVACAHIQVHLQGKGWRKEDCMEDSQCNEPPIFHRRKLGRSYAHITPSFLTPRIMYIQPHYPYILLPSVLCTAITVQYLFQ